MRPRVHEKTLCNWEKRGVLRAVRLPGVGYGRFRLADVERLQREMVSQVARADTGPVVRDGFKRARIVHGDDV